MKKILVIDDEAELVDLVKERLTHNRYEVVTASNGEEGLSKAKAEKPHLIVLDIVMPQMDGYTFLRQLKTIDALRSVPILVLTAKEKMVDLFKMEGVEHYFIKPYDPKAFIEKVRELVGE